MGVSTSALAEAEYSYPKETPGGDDGYEEGKGFAYVESSDQRAPTFRRGATFRVAGDLYTLIDPIDAGTYGSVYAARSEDGGMYAIKVMQMKGWERIVARSELSVFDLLSSVCKRDKSGYQLFPCMRSVQTFASDTLVMVMDLVPGKSLYRLFRNGALPDLSEDDFIRLVGLFLEPIEQMHLLGVSHNDLKPDNALAIFNQETGEPEVVTLIDFGLSCTASGSQEDRETCHTKFAADQVSPMMDPAYKEGITNRFQADVYGAGKTIAFLLKAQAPMLSSDTRESLNGLVRDMTTERAESRTTIRRARAMVRRLLYDSGDAVRVEGVEYVIEKYLSSGTYGSLYVVHPTAQPEQQFALKIQSNRGLSGGASGRELALMQGLPEEACRSGYVACLHASEVDLIEGQTYMVMEYFSLGDMQSYTRKHAPKTGKRIVQWAAAMVRATLALHEVGVASLDIKFNNFVVTVAPGDDYGAEPAPRVAVIDLGLACSTGMERDQPELCRLNYSKRKNKAPPRHIAPELYGGAQNIFAADVYSLGMALLKLLWIVVDEEKARRYKGGRHGRVVGGGGGKGTARKKHFVTAITEDEDAGEEEERRELTVQAREIQDAKARQKEIDPKKFPNADKRTYVALHKLSRHMRSPNFRQRPSLKTVAVHLNRICVDMGTRGGCRAFNDIELPNATSGRARRAALR